MAPLQIVIRQVWQSNLVYEFNLINQSLFQFPIVSIDTEFPGTVFQPVGVPNYVLSSLSPAPFYAILKQNVDALKLIQLGLTLSDAHGNLPHFGTGFHHVWQFNFRDFDLDCDLQNPESIALLKRQGMDFLKNKQIGVDSQYFAWMFRTSGLRINSFYGNLTWITFYGPYDFGFLIKILTGRKLPENLNEFLMLVRHYFGVSVYDLKPMIRFTKLDGGLERVATRLNLNRAVGKSHQAGSDSLMTMQIFVELRKKYLNNCDMMMKYNHKLYGVTMID